MTSSRAEADRTLLEMCRETLGEPLAQQGLLDFMNANIISEFDFSLGNAYQRVSFIYYKNRMLEREGDVQIVLEGNIRRHLAHLLSSDVLGELEKLTQSGRIPSVPFGVMDVIERGLQGKPLTEDYSGNNAVQGLYERAQLVATQMKEKGITLQKHLPHPNLNRMYYSSTDEGARNYSHIFY